MLYLNGNPEYSTINIEHLTPNHHSLPSLFDAPLSHCDSDLINPFKLKLHPSQFYRLKETGVLPKAARSVRVCVYFIIELHRKYKLDVKMCSAFWYDTPDNRTARLKLERELILRWQSPFGKI